MEVQQLWEKPKRKPSAYRRSLRTATFEGIPALLIQNLIGGPFLTAYLLYLGAGPAQVGIVMAIPPLANMIQILVALYMDRFANRRFYLALSGGLHRLLWVLTGLIPLWLPAGLAVPAYILIYLFSFFSAAFSSVIWGSLVGDMVPAQVRGRYFGIRNMLLYGAGSAALLVGGQILKYYPGGNGFAVLYGISAVCVVWNVIMLYRYPNLPFEPSVESNRFNRMKMPLQDKPFFGVVLFMAAFALIQNLVVPLFSYLMLDVLSVSVDLVSFITILHVVAIMFGNLFWGNLNRKFSARLLLYWTFPAYALSCLVWLLVPIMHVVVVMIVSHILLGIALAGTMLLQFNFVIGDTPKSERPMYIAVLSAITGLSGFIGPIIGGVVFRVVKPLPEWVEAYGVVVLAGGIMLLMAAAGRRLFFRQNAR